MVVSFDFPVIFVKIANRPGRAWHGSLPPAPAGMALFHRLGPQIAPNCPKIKAFCPVSG
jgi:hypothetical protein